MYKNGDQIIYICLALLFLLGVASFYVNPSYEKGVWIAMLALSHTLSCAAGAKYGLSVPKEGGKDASSI